MGDTVRCAPGGGIGSSASPGGPVDDEQATTTTERPIQNALPLRWKRDRI
jgi:hypothetical protein